MKEKKTKKIGGLYKHMLMMTILPLIVLGVVILIVCYKNFERAMLGEIRIELGNMATSIEKSYDELYPGDYELKGSSYIAVVKGENVLNGNTDLIDNIHRTSDIEISIFYKDARILTTLKDKNGIRYTGSAARALVIKSVEEEDREQFYPSVDISGDEYYAYYKPLHNSDGSVVGMIELAKESKGVKKYILQAVFPTLVIVGIFIVIIALITFSYATGLTKTIKSIDQSVNYIAQGNLSTEIDGTILKRDDELGRIAGSVKSMERELRNLIEQDGLTGISNRRNGESQLRKYVQRATIEGDSFVIVMADIDYFKRVNDRYGHEAGDIVLKGVAAIMKKYMRKSGMVSRWGGEEFLLLFESNTLEEAGKILEQMSDEIRTTQFEHGGHIINVTMTFGAQEGRYDMTMEELVKHADELLYEGKQNGRNQIVTSKSSCNFG